MPMPWTFRHPGKEWSLFLDDIRDVLGTPSANVAYTAAEGVLHAFRARLTTQQALDFAQCLPAVPRALFVQGWTLADPVSWAGQDVYITEALALRRHHNFADASVLRAVSIALHRAVGLQDLRASLQRIGPEAVAFWAVEGLDEFALQARIR